MRCCSAVKRRSGKTHEPDLPALVMETDMLSRYAQPSPVRHELARMSPIHALQTTRQHQSHRFGRAQTPFGAGLRESVRHLTHETTGLDPRPQRRMTRPGQHAAG